MKKFGDARDWFFDRRFGLFLHWGLYAIQGFHEQDQMRRRIPRQTYGELADQWDPVHFDPDAWLDVAEAAQMRYAVLTTRHHDGFCLFHTRQTDFHVGQTPYQKDIVGAFVEACHRRDFAVGLYYSVVDWHHPNYPNQGRHHELPGPEPGDEPDLFKFMEFVKAQVRELCTNYGRIDAFWWDMNVPEHHDPSINAMIRGLQPSCVINGRGMDEGDTATPERHWDEDVRGARVYTRLTEACESVGRQSWGYRKEESYHSDRHLMKGLATHLVKGGNYLLNVGPDAEGRIPEQSEAILRRVGAWYDRVRPALEAEALADWIACGWDDVLVTRSGNTIYLLLVGQPNESDLVLEPVVSLPTRATLLNTGQSLTCANDMLPWQWVEGHGYLRVRGLPVNELANQVMVVRLDFDEEPQRKQTAPAIDEAMVK